MKTLKVLQLIVLVLLFFPQANATEVVEVVQSVPLETTLAVPGVRFTDEVWLEMINGAQKRIDLEQMYVSEQAGEALTPVISALESALARGVKVRLIVDSKFFSTYPETVKKIARLQGAEARTIDFSKFGGIQHAKYFVVDSQHVFLGSQNFDWRAISHIHEVGLKVSDPQIASTIESIFEKDWSNGAGVAAPQSRKPVVESSSVRVDATPQSLNPPEVDFSQKTLVNLMAGAKTSIQIEMYAYQIKGKKGKWLALDSALRQAAARGVRVQLLVDAVALKNGKTELDSLSKVKNIEVRSVLIPPWSGGAIEYARLIHSKFMVIDGLRAWVGSANWSENYFTSSRNVGLVVESQSVASTLAKIHTQVWTSAYASPLN